MVFSFQNKGKRIRQWFISGALTLPLTSCLDPSQNLESGWDSLLFSRRCTHTPWVYTHHRWMHWGFRHCLLLCPGMHGILGPGKHCCGFPSQESPWHLRWSQGQACWCPALSRSPPSMSVTAPWGPCRPFSSWPPGLLGCFFATQVLHQYSAEYW